MLNPEFSHSQIFQDNNPRAVTILGVPISCITLQDATSRIEDWRRTEQKHYVCVREVSGLVEAWKSEKLRQIHFGAGMVVPDGMPLVWIAKWRGQSHTQRVCGRDLFSAVLKKSEITGASHYFFGGTETSLKKLCDEVRTRFPKVNIAGTEAPPFRALTPLELESAVTKMNSSGADYIWIGIGSPKQEYLMSELRPKLNATALFGVGAVFDFYSGIKPIAPKWMQKAGLEWVFRFMTEPRRLWKRYLIRNPVFVGAVLIEEWKRLVWKRS